MISLAWLFQKHSLCVSCLMAATNQLLLHLYDFHQFLLIVHKSNLYTGLVYLLLSLFMQNHSVQKGQSVTHECKFKEGGWDWLVCLQTKSVAHTECKLAIIYTMSCSRAYHLLSVCTIAEMESTGQRCYVQR